MSSKITPKYEKQGRCWSVSESLNKERQSNYSIAQSNQTYSPVEDQNRLCRPGGPSSNSPHGCHVHLFFSVSENNSITITNPAFLLDFSI